MTKLTEKDSYSISVEINYTYCDYLVPIWSNDTFPKVQVIKKYIVGAQSGLNIRFVCFLVNLYRHRQKIEKLKTEAVVEHDELIKAMSTFVELLKDADVDHSGTISREELRRALEKVSMG